MKKGEFKAGETTATTRRSGPDPPVASSDPGAGAAGSAPGAAGPGPAGRGRAVGSRASPPAPAGALTPAPSTTTGSA